MKLDNEELIHTIKRQNNVNGSHIKIVKKIMKMENKDDRQARNRSKEKNGLIIMEVDEEICNLMLKKK